jgi:hypothetical protein
VRHCPTWRIHDESTNTEQQNKQKKVYFIATNSIPIGIGVGKYYIFLFGKGKELFGSIGCKPILLADVDSFLSLLHSLSNSHKWVGFGLENEALQPGSGTFFGRVNPGDLQVRLGVDQPDSSGLWGTGRAQTPTPLRHNALHLQHIFCHLDWTGLEWMDRINL